MVAERACPVCGLSLVDAAACDGCVERLRPDRGTIAEEGPHRVKVDGAVWAWAEPTFVAWSAVLPLLVVPPVLHALLTVPDSGEPHSDWWLLAFGAIWLFVWLLGVPCTCHVAFADGSVKAVRCATRGQALRLAATVRRLVGREG